MPLILASNTIGSGFERSRLTSFTPTLSGASANFAAGVIERSSKSIAASFTSTPATCTFHSLPPAPGASAGAVAVAGFPAAGAAVPSAEDAAVGAPAGGGENSVVRLISPFASFHICAVRLAKVTLPIATVCSGIAIFVSLSVSKGICTQSASTPRARSARPESSIFGMSALTSVVPPRATL